MAFDKYLKKARIEKKIDPGVDPKAITPEKGSVERPPTDRRPTPVANLVDDVLALSRQVRQVVRDTILEIEAENNTDSGFVAYAELARKTSFDATRLLTDPNARPEAIDHLRLKVLERDVYRRLTDPRAPFLQDLHRMDMDASISEYAVQRLWQRAVGVNAAFTNGLESRLPRFALFKDKQHLQMLSRQASAIRQLGVEPLSTWDVQGLIEQISRTIGAASSAVHNIEEAIKGLSGVRQLLNLSVFRLTEGWEKFSDITGGCFGNPISYISGRLTREMNYISFAGLKDQVLDMVEVIDLLPDGTGLPGMTELKNQVQEEIFRMAQGIEEDLLFRERTAIELEEARALLLMNAHKLGVNKRLVNLLSAAISVLESNRSKPRSSSSGTDQVLEALATGTVTAARFFEGLIAIGPPTEPVKTNEA